MQYSSDEEYNKFLSINIVIVIIFNIKYLRRKYDTNNKWFCYDR